MKTSDQIIIEELKRIVLMQAQENTRLITQINVLAVLAHDCWKAHFQTPVKAHQLCTAHLERETKYLEEHYKVVWPVRFRVMLREAHKLKKHFTPADYKRN